MNKLTLNVDELRVETFDASPVEALNEEQATLRHTGVCDTCYQTC